VRFQARLTLALLAIAALPLAILGYGVQREMRSRLDAEAVRRLDAVRSEVGARLAELVATDRRRLEALAAELSGDNRFRLAVANPASGDRRWLIDWAPAAMAISGLAVLQVQDAGGRLLSSGQFRNDFDRILPPLPLAGEPSSLQAVVVDARTPTESVRALVSSVTFSVAGAAFTLAGGTAFDSARVAALSSDRAVASLLATRGMRLPDGATGAASLPYLNEATHSASVATLYLVADASPVIALRQGVRRWLLITLGGTLLVAVVVATLLGRVVSAPIAALASRTARLDLDRLDQHFTTGRRDELGALERTLDALAGRLRTSAARLRDAERAAATGDLARQVNHDVKNGLAPIRNVLRHLAQVAEREPDTLAAVFAERRGTLDSSVEYLDQLARNYARLSPTLGGGRSDPRPVVLDVARATATTAVDVHLPDALPFIRADAVVLHRILGNLVSNAVDALEGQPGTVAIGAHVVGEGAEQRVRFTVRDTGRGMTRLELDQAFNDFHTTKPTGTGLGLSVVRRLLTDVGGSVRAETTPGQGSTFTVDIPVAPA